MLIPPSLVSKSKSHSQTIDHRPRLPLLTSLISSQAAITLVVAQSTRRSCRTLGDTGPDGRCMTSHLGTPLCREPLLEQTSSFNFCIHSALFEGHGPCRFAWGTILTLEPILVWHTAVVILHMRIQNAKPDKSCMIANVGA